MRCEKKFSWSNMEALKLISVLNNILDLMNILDLRGLEKDVLKASIEHGVAAYDACSCRKTWSYFSDRR